MDRSAPPTLPVAIVDADPIIGRAVGNYVVERKIGQGGMGAVYLARHCQLPETLAALKVFAGDGATSERRFEQEALAAAAVGSHRVVRPFDLGRFPDGRRYILMEYVAGRSLGAELAAFGPMPVATALRIVYRIADTMTLAHRKGIVHRDLKPENVMLQRVGDRDFVVKLLDFGVARTSGPLKVAQTAARAILGTPGYLSPEAAAGLVVDGRSDVFSLGVVAFKLLAGELPLRADTLGLALESVLTDDAPPVSTRRPAHLDPVPPSVDALIARALTRDPAARPTMAALQRDLYAVLAELAAAPDAPEPDPLASLASSVVPADEAAEAPPSAAAMRELLARLDAPAARGAAAAERGSAVPGDPGYPTSAERPARARALAAVPLDRPPAGATTRVVPVRPGATPSVAPTPAAAPSVAPTPAAATPLVHTLVTAPRASSSAVAITLRTPVVAVTEERPPPPTAPMRMVVAPRAAHSPPAPLPTPHGRGDASRGRRRLVGLVLAAYVALAALGAYELAAHRRGAAPVDAPAPARTPH